MWTRLDITEPNTLDANNAAPSEGTYWFRLGGIGHYNPPLVMPYMAVVQNTTGNKVISVHFHVDVNSIFSGDTRSSAISTERNILCQTSQTPESPTRWGGSYTQSTGRDETVSVWHVSSEYPIITLTLPRAVGTPSHSMRRVALRVWRPT